MGGNVGGIEIGCPKCGVGINVSPEQIEEAKRLNVPLTVEHEVCPRDARDVHPFYHFTITLTRKSVEVVTDDVERENEVVIAQMGGEVQAPTFAEALPNLMKDINKQWERVAEMAHIADQD